MPSYEIERVGDLEQDLVLEYDIALANDATLVAALRTNNSYLKVAQFQLESGGGIVNTGEAQTVQAANVSLSLPTATHWVTSAVKTAGGRLLVSRWSPVVLRDDAEGMAAANSAIVSFGTLFTVVPPPANPPPPPGTLAKHPEGYLAVTTNTNGLNQLRISAWLAGNNMLTDLATVIAPGRHTKVSLVPYQTLPGNGRLESATVIVASISSGNLRLSTWRMSVLPEQLPTLSLVGETLTEVAITEVSAALFHRRDGDYLATAVITDGKLSLLTWKIQADGTFTRWMDATAGAASGIDCVRIRRSDLAVGCRDSANKLRIIYWRFPYSKSGTQEVIRMGTATAGTLGNLGGVKLAHTSATLANPGSTIAACRAKSGKLKLIRFRLSNGD